MEGDCRVNGMNMSTNDCGHSFHWMKQVALILFSILIRIKDGQSFTCFLNVSGFFFFSTVNFEIIYLNVTFSLSHNTGKQQTTHNKT